MTSPDPARLVPGEATLLSPRVRRILAPNPSVMTGPGTNTYLVGAVAGDGPVCVIDPGPDDAAHLQVIERAGAGRIRMIVVTHGHPDHWPGAAPLAAATGAEVLAHPGLVGAEVLAGASVGRALADGERIPVGDVTLRVLHTPGHAPDHLCLLLEEERLLFTGDQVMHGSTVVIPPPAGDLPAYLGSLRRLLALQPPLRTLAPAHGHPFHDPATAIGEILAHRARREAKVLAALVAAEEPATVDELLPVVYDDIEPRRLPIARASLWAHLRKLVDEGRASTTGYDEPESGRWSTTEPRPDASSS